MGIRNSFRRRLEMFTVSTSVGCAIYPVISQEAKADSRIYNPNAFSASDNSTWSTTNALWSKADTQIFGIDGWDAIFDRGDDATLHIDDGPGKVAVNTLNITGCGSYNFDGDPLYASNSQLTISTQQYGGVVEIDNIIDDSLVSGGSELVLTGGGRLLLTAANTYTGGTDIQAGRLEIRNSTALGLRQPEPWRISRAWRGGRPPDAGQQIVCGEAGL